jgi:hypothetical protein
MATQKEYEKMSESDKKKEDWMNSKWRPMMGWMYMAVCMADFVLFPVLWSLVQAAHGGSVQTQWIPITLQGAGLFHMAMGAIIGVAAFGRTQEKLAGANNGGMQPVGQSVTTTYGSPSAGGFGASNSFGSSSSNSFGGNSGFGAPASGFGATSKPATGKSAKFAEADPDSVFDRG